MIKLYTNECLYKDVYTIIEMMSPDLRIKINEKFIEFLRQNQDVAFQGTIDKNVPLREQNLREEIKVMLSLMYISYFCTEEKRKEILMHDNENIDKFYNKDIFKKNDENVISENQEKNTTLQIVEYKHNFLTRILRKIKCFLFNKGSK